MVRAQRLPFSAESTFKANRPFVLNGIQLGYDDIVDTGDIEERRLFQMYQARLIDVVEGQNIAPKAKAPKPKTTKAPKPVEAPAPAPVVTADAPADAPKAAAVHKGFGKYNIESSTGEVLASGLSKEEAEKQLPNYL